MDFLPDNREEWVNLILSILGWLFSVVIAGIGVNLISPKIGRYLDQRSEQRRIKRLARNKAESQYVDEMVKLIKENPHILTVVTHNSVRLRLTSISFDIVGRLLAVMALVVLLALSQSQFSPLIIILFGGGFFISRLGHKYSRQGDLFDIIVARYEDQLRLPKPPK